MKWACSYGLIYFSFHQIDYFLSHITAIPLSTLAAGSQLPLHSVQCTQKQFSLNQKLPLVKVQPQLREEQQSLPWMQYQSSKETSLGILHIQQRARISPVSTGHLGGDFSWLMSGKIRDALASAPPGEDRLALGLFHSYFWLAHWVNKMALNSWYSTNMSQRRSGCQCLSHTQTDTASHSVWMYKEPKLLTEADWFVAYWSATNHHIKEPRPSLNILLWKPHNPEDFDMNFQCFLFHGAFSLSQWHWCHLARTSLWAQPRLSWAPLGTSKSFILGSGVTLWGPMVVAEDGCDDGSCAHVVPLKSRHTQVLSLQTPELEADVLALCPWRLHSSVQPQGIWSESLSPAWGCLFLFTKTSVNSWLGKIQLKRGNFPSVESRRNFAFHLNATSD